MTIKINTPQKEKDVIEFSKKSDVWCKKNKIPNFIEEKEYDIEKYKKVEKEIRNREEEIFNPIDAEIVITAYGTYGFYNPDTNKVFVNVYSPVDFIEVINHEIIHITVESYVKNKTHEQKEEIIDIIYNFLNKHILKK